MPELLVRASRLFETFYLGRHTGRRLTWQPSLGNVDVRVAFRSKTHDLNVATYALVVLLLFEELPDDEFLTYEVRIQRLIGFWPHYLILSTGNTYAIRHPRC
jgi:cullin 3